MKKIKISKIITVLLVLIFTGGLMGCGKSNTPEAAVKNYFDAVAKGDMDSASEYAELNLDNAEKNESDAFTKAYFKKISCEVKEAKEDGDNAVVKAEISAPDMGDIMGNMMKEYMPKMLSASIAGEDTTKLEKEMEKAIEEMFSDESKIKIVKNEVDINLIKKDGSWIISDDNSELGNALTGNFLESLQLPLE